MPAQPGRRFTAGGELGGSMAGKKLKIDFRDNRVRIALAIALIGIAGAVALYQYLIVPAQEQLNQLEQTLNDKQNELNTIRTIEQQMARLEQALELSNRELDSLRSIFPDEKEIPKLIREITRVARASGIYTRRFNPLPDVVREYYVENRYSLSVSGGYHELAHFFSFLANLPLMINVSNVDLKANPGIQQSIDDYKLHGGVVETIEATFEMTTFSSKR